MGLGPINLGFQETYFVIYVSNYAYYPFSNYFSFAIAQRVACCKSS